MRDAVSLLNKRVTIGEEVYKITDFYHIPGNQDIYAKLKSKSGSYLNYEYKKLQPLIQEQIKL